MKGRFEIIPLCTVFILNCFVHFTIANWWLIFRCSSGGSIICDRQDFFFLFIYLSLYVCHCCFDMSEDSAYSLVWVKISTSPYVTFFLSLHVDCVLSSHSRHCREEILIVVDGIFAAWELLNAFRSMISFLPWTLWEFRNWYLMCLNPVICASNMGTQDRLQK